MIVYVLKELCHESRSALQGGFEKTKNVVTGNGLPLVSTKKRNAGSNNTLIMIHGRGVDKALVAEQKPPESRKCNLYKFY